MKGLSTGYSLRCARAQNGPCEFCAFEAWTKGSTRLPRRMYAGSLPACLPRHHGTQSLAYARLERHKRSVMDKGREIREKGREIQK